MEYKRKLKISLEKRKNKWEDERGTEKCCDLYGLWNFYGFTFRFFVEKGVRVCDFLDLTIPDLHLSYTVFEKKVQVQEVLSR